jgi:hypothetical protein
MDHKHHFRIAYGVLALAFWISIAGFIVLITRQQHAAELRWSQWRPASQGLAGAREIAQKVAPRYRSPNGTQLAAVQEQLPIYNGYRVDAIGVRELNPSGQLSPYIGLFGTNKTLVYSFCGLESSCSIQGASTSVHERTLRREALELSLYAFKYLKGVDQVVSLVQTTKTSGTSAIFLRKADLASELARPLRSTLPLSVPPPAGTIDRREAPTIDSLTLQNTFPAHFEPLPDGDAILVLDISS